MNSYLDTLVPGDFILHFPGIGSLDKLTAMEEYAKKVVGSDAAASLEQLARFHTALAPAFQTTET